MNDNEEIIQWAKGVNYWEHYKDAHHNGNIKMVKLFRSLGALCHDAKDTGTACVLESACYGGNVELIELCLLENHFENCYSRAFIGACKGNNIEVAKMFYDQKYVREALIQALYNDAITVSKWLHELHPDVIYLPSNNPKYSIGESALSNAIAYGKEVKGQWLYNLDNRFLIPSMFKHGSGRSLFKYTQKLQTVEVPINILTLVDCVENNTPFPNDVPDLFIDALHYHHKTKELDMVH